MIKNKLSKHHIKWFICIRFSPKIRTSLNVTFSLAWTSQECDTSILQ